MVFHQTQHSTLTYDPSTDLSIYFDSICFSRCNMRNEYIIDWLLHCGIYKNNYLNVKINLCKLRYCCSNVNANSIHTHGWAFFDGELDGLFVVRDDIKDEDNDLIGPHLLKETNALTGGNDAKL